jgi:hypothetical protein
MKISFVYDSIRILKGDAAKRSRKSLLAALKRQGIEPKTDDNEKR